MKRKHYSFHSSCHHHARAAGSFCVDPSRSTRRTRHHHLRLPRRKFQQEEVAELAPILEDAAETGVTLVDESGEPLPLAVEETAEVLASGDPW